MFIEYLAFYPHMLKEFESTPYVKYFQECNITVSKVYSHCLLSDLISHVKIACDNQYSYPISHDMFYFYIKNFSGEETKTYIRYKKTVYFSGKECKANINLEDIYEKTLYIMKRKEEFEVINYSTTKEIDLLDYITKPDMEMWRLLYE